MLSHIGSHDHVIAQHLVNHFKDILRHKSVLRDRLRNTEGIDLLQPYRIFLLLRLFQKPAENLPHIPDETEIDDDIFVDFRLVDIDLSDDRILCKMIDITCHTVTESGADSDQKVAVVHRLICFLLSVHSHHPQ